MKTALEIVSFLGNKPTPYEQVWEFQKKRVDEIANGTARECLIFCEHPLTVTAGRRAKKENVLDATLPVFEIERGGDMTLHSSGQLVIYPLLKLHGEIFKKGLSEYLRLCEQVVINVLENFDLRAGRFGPTGIWIEEDSGTIRKIGSIGIAVRRWITYHGIAINISNDLNEFSKIRPCNFESSVMTSLSQQGIKISLEDFSLMLRQEFESELFAQLKGRERHTKMSAK
jgi:lipoyl(octanoyl) transferase